MVTSLVTAVHGQVCRFTYACHSTTVANLWLQYLVATFCPHIFLNWVTYKLSKLSRYWMKVRYVEIRMIIS